MDNDELEQSKSMIVNDEDGNGIGTGIRTVNDEEVQETVEISDEESDKPPDDLSIDTEITNVIDNAELEQSKPLTLNDEDGNGIGTGTRTVNDVEGQETVEISDAESDKPESVKPPDYLSIATEISNYMQVNKVNMGELSTLEDMWEICDAISAAYSGLPDSLLKEAFLIVLESQYHRAQNNSWYRIQLDRLIKSWKKQANKLKTRETKFISSTAEFSPPSSPIVPTVPIEQTKSKNRKMKGSRKRALTAMMGVGELLSHARKKFATEEGELDVEEDEYGNFSIGGVDLSFENWGSINRIKDDDIVHVRSTNIRPQKKKRIAHTNGTKFAASTSFPTPPKAPKESEFEEPIIDEEGEVVEGPARKPEKDEGEISESGTESSSSSEEEHRNHARNRRRKRRQVERHQGGTSSVQNLGSIFSKCYEYRFKIAHKLSLQQKAHFLETLKQNKEGAVPEQQQQMTAQFMGSFLSFLNSTPT